jgi:hypothetical protein
VARKNRFDSILSLKGGSTAAAGSPTDASQKKGKRSDPNYTQISAYILKDTHRAVMQAIVTKRDLSDLIEELFTEWLKKQK